MKKETIFENYYYVTDKSFRFSLEDDRDRKFGILFEILDMYEATGEKEYKQYPFLVSASIMADKCHKSFGESDRDFKPTKLDLIYDTNSYMGGVPVDHVLTHAIRSHSEGFNDLEESNFKLVAKQFSALEAKVVTQKQDFGTIAAQKGREHEHSWLQFKTFEAAEKFMKYLIENRVSAMSMLIGFTLDKPINMMGETGWSVMSHQVKGSR